MRAQMASEVVAKANHGIIPLELNSHHHQKLEMPYGVSPLSERNLAVK